MALASNALIDLRTAKDHLMATGSSDDGLIEEMVNRASELCEGQAGRPLKQRTLTVRLTGPPWPRLALRVVPVKADSAVTVSVDGLPQTVWRTESDGDPATFDVALGSFDPQGGRGPDHLYRALGWAGNYPDNVLLTYTGGFATVPSDLQQACLDIVQKLFRDAKRQLAEVASVSGPFGSVSVLDTAIPRRAELLLRRYEITAVA